MDRDSTAYQEAKWAWELMQTKAWREFLHPLLTRKANPLSRKGISTLDDAFTRAAEDAEINYARYLLAVIARKAAQLKQTPS